MVKLEYETPFIQWVALSEEDVIRTSLVEDTNAGYAWESDWSQAFGDGNV